MIGEELLKPSREYLAILQGRISALEAETMEKVNRYPDDKEYVRDLWLRFDGSVLPMRREIEAVVKTIADYYGAQPMPPQIVVPASS